MRTIFTLVAGAITFLSATTVSAAPVAPKSVAELLGLRSGASTQMFANADVTPATQHNSLRAPMAAQESADTKIVASVVFPDNAQGMWSYTTTSWNPTRLSIDPKSLPPAAV